MNARASDGTGQRGHTAPQHVWVRHGDDAVPGVLIDWRQDGGDWEAHVLYATGPEAIVQEWVPADRVRPVET